MYGERCRECGAILSVKCLSLRFHLLDLELAIFGGLGVDDRPLMLVDRQPVRRDEGLARSFFGDNLQVRIYFIIVMITWTGVAPWVFERPFPGSLTSTFL